MVVDSVDVLEVLGIPLNLGGELQNISPCIKLLLFRKSSKHHLRRATTRQGTTAQQTECGQAAGGGILGKKCITTNIFFNLILKLTILSNYCYLSVKFSRQLGLHSRRLRLEREGSDATGYRVA